MGTSNNCHQSSGAPNLPANDSALFSFRFYAVHPKDVRDCQLRQLFEVPLYLIFTLFPALPQDRRKLCVVADIPQTSRPNVRQWVVCHERRVSIRGAQLHER
jgi:hypothetical protein